MDPITRELTVIRSLSVRAEYYAVSARLFTGTKHDWRITKSQRLANLALVRTERLINMITDAVSKPKPTHIPAPAKALIAA